MSPHLFVRIPINEEQFCPWREEDDEGEFVVPNWPNSISRLQLMDILGETQNLLGN